MEPRKLAQRGTVDLAVNRRDSPESNYVALIRKV